MSSAFNRGRDSGYLVRLMYEMVRISKAENTIKEIINKFVS